MSQHYYSVGLCKKNTISTCTTQTVIINVYYIGGHRAVINDPLPRDYTRHTSSIPRNSKLE